MKKKLLAIIAIIIVMATLASPSAFAGGQLRASNYFNAYSASISKSSTTITISFSVTATGTMTTLGVSSIEIYKRNPNSVSWTYVTTLNSSNTSGLTRTNHFTYTSSAVYTGETGKEYYAKVTFYAANSGGSETTQPISTNSVTL
jgi:hypothetical protein